MLNHIENCRENVKELVNFGENLNINVSCEWKSDLDLEIKENVDLTFIYTLYVYPLLTRELNNFSKVTNKYIIMHDTTIHEYKCELYRGYWDLKLN